MPAPVKLKRNKTSAKKKSLAGYAAFLLHYHLDEFVSEILKLTFDYKVPVLKYLKNMSDTQLKELAAKSNAELLTYLAEGKEQVHIQAVLKRWLSDQLPIIEKDQVVIDDITLVSHIRKKAFLHFLPLYTKDTRKVISIIEELDDYILKVSSSTLSAFIELLEERIHEQAHLSEKVNNTTPGIIYVYDRLKNKEIYINRRISDQLGYRLEDIHHADNSWFGELIHPDDMPQVHKHINTVSVLPDGAVTHVEYRIKNKKGIYRWHRAYESVFKRNKDGSVWQTIGISFDIENEKGIAQQLNQSLEKLRESDMLFKQAQSITHIGNYVWNLETNALSWSEELYRIYGLEPGVDLADSGIIRSFNHPEDADTVSQHIAHSKETHEPFDFYYRIVLPDKTIKHLHARGNVLTNAMGKADKIIGTAQDVTAQKELERKLMDNQIFIRKIADATPSLIALYHIRTGRYVFLNKSIKNLLGYEPQAVLEKGANFFLEVIHPDDVPEVMKKNARAVEEANDNPPGDRHESIVEFQYRMKHVNGDYRWFHTFGTVFDRNSKNEVEHILNISLDITERVKAEQVILQRTAELQQSNASLEEFAFVASHDLKEPLRKIITFTDRLMSKEAKNISDEGKAYLDKVMNSSIRMQQMVSDLLSLSVISADKTFTSVSLHKLLHEVLTTLEYKMEETRAVVHADELPEAQVVPAQFRQLFQNIISNSLKFAQPNIPPVISIRYYYASAQDVTNYALTQATRYLVLEFSDNGIGFDNAYVDKIFAVFQRLHHRDSYEGTGIGLAICKKIIENHSGTILASGVPSGGAKFTVILPQ